MALSVDDLRAFTLVAGEQSVSRTAALVGVSQQSVSERIRRLERRVGVDLFDRLPFGMGLTSAGYRLLPYARRCVALIDQAMEVVLDEALVRVQVHAPIAEIAEVVLGDRLGAFTVEATSAADASLVLAAVGEGAADLGIGVFWEVDLEPPPGMVAGDPSLSPLTSPDVAVEVLFHDPLVCVAAPDHPLRDRDVTMADLGAHGLGLGSWLGSRRVDLGDAVQLRTESAVVGPLARGELVALRVVDLPAWSLPVSLAYRPGDAHCPSVAAVRASSARPPA